MTSDISNKILGILSPSTGDFVAKSSLTAACKLSGTSIDDLKKEELSKVVDQLEIMLNMRFGPQISKSLKEKILAI